jgi:hypothetical protein
VIDTTRQVPLRRERAHRPLQGHSRKLWVSIRAAR